MLMVITLHHKDHRHRNHLHSKIPHIILNKIITHLVDIRNQGSLIIKGLVIGRLGSSKGKINQMRDGPKKRNETGEHGSRNKPKMPKRELRISRGMLKSSSRKLSKNIASSKKLTLRLDSTKTPSGISSM